MNDNTAEDDELQSFVHRWADAIVANDTSRMEDFVTEDWMLVDGPGIIPGDVFHGVVASGQLRHDTMTHELLHIRSVTNDVAILVTQASNSGSFQGEPISADECTSDVLVRTAESLSAFSPSSRLEPNEASAATIRSAVSARPQPHRPPTTRPPPAVTRWQTPARPGPG